MAARNALLKYLRVNVKPVLPLQNPRAGVGGLSQLIRRHFSDEAKGSFLDKSEVTDRVLCVVKNFQKVDPSKVSCFISWLLYYRSVFFLSFFVLMKHFCFYAFGFLRVVLWFLEF
ncbi:acyl carrier protein 2 mitochondrial [Phtheirospermum japonicum]|uniref:Acyl carrier protein 2 mitochondrial n=1 Tax=Phtheirospermum japonicum TaxID=374723 RepID=A0A830BP45_9LAMI|nr:acyl carrier protein 2 mitochondrial [Phtheirospermum japonicum]